MLTELLILLALVAANGLFAGAEIALLTAAKGRVQQLAAARDRRALAVVALREQPSGSSPRSRSASRSSARRQARSVAPGSVVRPQAWRSRSPARTSRPR